eukprot:TRINITY_DN25792_c1_g2_i2.p5 TRINITY_DN25792_c1_g2~~TRINITY_DN25792_c1_g2_i2.p5  ORF type:complete len:100 (-),score=11.27 TRINITY_DN25792_c1_g2_i2:1032-1331(-)
MIGYKIHSFSSTKIPLFQQRIRNHKKLLIKAAKQQQQQQQKQNIGIPQSKDEMLQQVKQVVASAAQKIGKVKKGFGSSQNTNYRKVMIEVLVQGEQYEI